MLLFGAVDLAEVVHLAPTAALRVHGGRGAPRHPRRFRAGRDRRGRRRGRRRRAPSPVASRRVSPARPRAAAAARRRSALGPRRRATRGLPRARSLSLTSRSGAHCDAVRPPADGTGGSGHRVMVRRGYRQQDRHRRFHAEPAGRRSRLPRRRDRVLLLRTRRRCVRQSGTPTRRCSLSARRLGGTAARAATPASRPRGGSARALARRCRRGRVPEAGLRLVRSDVPTARQGRHLVVATRGRARRRRRQTRSSGIDGGAALLAFSREGRHGFPDLNSAAVARPRRRTPSSWRLLDAATLPGRRRPHDDRVHLRHRPSRATTRRHPGRAGRRWSTPDTSARTPGSCDDEDAFRAARAALEGRGPPVPRFGEFVAGRRRSRTGRHVRLRFERFGCGR